MKTIITICFTLISYFTFAQEISIKKGKILFDDKEVALIDKKKKIFTISTLDNSSSFNFVKSDEKLSNGVFALLYEITDPKTNEKNHLIITKPKRGLNSEKVLAENITLSYKFITPDGLDVEKINAFITGEKIVPEEKIEEINKEISQFIKDSKAKFKANNLVFGSGWSINKIVDGKEVQVGYLTKNIKNLEYHIEVYKKDPITQKSTKVGIWSNSGETINFENKRDFLSQTLKTINGEEIYVESEHLDREKNSLKESYTCQLIVYYMTNFGYFD